MTIPKCPFSTQELSPCDNYRPATIFWPCPKVVIISDKHCTVKFVEIRLKSQMNSTDEPIPGGRFKLAPVTTADDG